MTADPRTYKVVVVDDSDTDRALISAFLRRSRIYKFELTQLDDPALLLSALAEQKYDCALIDFNMPATTGLDVIKELKAHYHGLPLATILLTGQGDESIAVEAIRLGAEDYLIKDRLQNGVLPRAVAKAVDSYDLRQRERKALESLSQREKLLRLMAENIPQLIWVSECDGKTSFVNNRLAEFSRLPAEQIGFSSPELLELVHPEDRSHCRTSWERALQAGTTFTADARLRDREGNYRWYLCRSEPVKDDDGNIINWFGTCTDVHDVRKVQHELLKREKKLQLANDELKTARDLALSANRAKSVFLASMSHEFRTPLNAVIGYAEMLAEDAEYDGLAQQATDLKRIQSAARHLLSLIDDVLDLARVEAGEMSVNLRKLDLVEVAWDAITTAQWLVEKNNNTLDVCLPEQKVYVFGDPTRMRQIIFNLLSNAAKFTKNGTVRITATVDKPDLSGLNTTQVPMVRVAIQDTGIGMSAEKIDNLFVPFYQGDDLVTERYGGTGLGLAISRNLCRMMNGDIEVVSEVGVGSTFTFVMPLAQMETAPA